MDEQTTQRHGGDAPVERALRQSNLTFEAIYDAVIIADADGRIVNWNPAAERIYGWRRDEVIGRIADFLQPDGTGPAVAGSIIERIQAGEIFEGELAFVTRDGRAGTTETVVVPVRDGAGIVVGSVGVNRDVSRRKAMETALRRRETELVQSQKMEAIGRLAGGLAHDFNNVLSTVSGYAQLLLDYDLPDEARADVQVMIDTLRHAASMTRQLLSLSRRAPDESRSIDPDDVLRSVVGMLERVIGRHIRLDIELDAGTCICIDAVRLEQIALNLLVNARDALPHGGRILLRSERIRAGTEGDAGPEAAPPTAAPGRDFIRITVQDDGAGMSPEVAARAFEPFFTTKSDEQGTGLGLATVYGIAVQHGGRADIASEPGRGTTVTVDLPVTDAAAGRPCRAGD